MSTSRVLTTLLSVLLITLGIFVYNGSKAVVHAQEVDQTVDAAQTPQVTLTVKPTTEYPEGHDWPIVSVERTETVDPETGLTSIHIRTVREGPKELPQSADVLCDVPVTSESAQALAAAPCNYQGQVLVTDTNTVGGVTHHIYHYAYKYCQDAGCTDDYYKPTKVDMWWTRTNSTWAAFDATLRWGCENCLECPNDNIVSNTYYNNGPFVPHWTGNTSYTYSYISSTWKILQGTGSDMIVGALGQSTIRQNGTYQGSTGVLAGWYGG